MDSAVVSQSEELLVDHSWRLLYTGKVRVFKDARLLAGCALVVDALRGSARHLMRVSLLNFDAWLQAAVKGRWKYFMEGQC